MEKRCILVIPSLCLLFCFVVMVLGQGFIEVKLGQFLVVVSLLLSPVALLCSIYGGIKVIRNFHPKKTAIFFLLAHILGILVIGFWVLALIAFIRMGPINPN